MDEWLDERGLYRKNNALDGTCLFRAVAEQLHPTDPVCGHLEIRRRCVKFMLDNCHMFKHRLTVPFEEYMEEMANPKAWAGPIELDAISLIYEVDFDVFHGPEPPLDVTRNGFKRTLMLCVTGNSFYDAVYPKSQVETFGFCQSIVYKLLYGEVFELPDLDYAVEKMLHDKAARAQRERYLNKQSIHPDDIGEDSYLEHVESPVNVKQIVDSGAILFPYKVAKALDPDIFRNIDFDNWVETNRGKAHHCLYHVPVARRSNFWYGSAGTLRLGAKCHVKLDERILTGHIQKLSPDLGPVVVFIEELAQKKTVKFEDLIPMPRCSMKPEWNYSHKHQMINKLGKKKAEEAQEFGKRRSRRNKVEIEMEDLSRNEDDSSRLELDPSREVSPYGSMSGKCVIITPSGEGSYINTSVSPSVKPDFSDLPIDDLETLRFYFNLGIKYFRAGTLYGGSSPSVFVTTEDMVTVSGMPSIPLPSAQLMQASAFQIIPQSAQMCEVSQGPSMDEQRVVTVQPLPVSPMVDKCLPPQPSVQTSPTVETPHRDQRERSRKFNKPPRFQRLHSSERKISIDTSVPPPSTNEVQHPEISSTTSPVLTEMSEGTVIPYSVATPMAYPVTCPPMIPYFYPPDEAVGDVYSDSFVEPHVEFVETPELSYPMPYTIYPSIPMYYN